jgi:hypothetical protein
VALSVGVEFSLIVGFEYSLVGGCAGPLWRG